MMDDGNSDDPTYIGTYLTNVEMQGKIPIEALMLYPSGALGQSISAPGRQVLVEYYVVTYSVAQMILAGASPRGTECFGQ
jgi:hypothetical protein